MINTSVIVLLVTFADINILSEVIYMLAVL
jgi:hypothetical protein